MPSHAITDAEAKRRAAAIAKLSSPEQGALRIRFENATLTLPCTKATRIAELQKWISHHYGVGRERQLWIWKAKCLKGERTLSDYGLAGNNVAFPVECRLTEPVPTKDTSVALEPASGSLVAATPPASVEVQQCSVFFRDTQTFCERVATVDCADCKGSTSFCEKCDGDIHSASPITSGVFGCELTFEEKHLPHSGHRRTLLVRPVALPWLLRTEDVEKAAALF